LPRPAVVAPSGHPPIPAAPEQKRPSEPLFAGVKRTASSIGGSAERKLARGWSQLKDVAASLKERRAKQNEALEAFSPVQAEPDAAGAVDGAIAAEEVAQAEQPNPHRLARVTPARGPGPLPEILRPGPRTAPKVSAAGAAPPVRGNGASAPAEAAVAAPSSGSQEQAAPVAAAGDASPAANGKGQEIAASPAEANGKESASHAPAGATNGKEQPAAKPKSAAPAPARKANGKKTAAQGAKVAPTADIAEGDPPAAAPGGGAEPLTNGARVNGADAPSAEAELEAGKNLFSESVIASESDPSRSSDLLDGALRSFEKAHERDPDSADVYRSWGYALVAKAVAAPDRQQGKLYRDAAQKFMEGNLRAPHQNDFTLASVYALAGDEKRCRKWLEESRHSGALDVESLREVPEFESMREKPWFRKYLQDDSA